MKTSPLRMPGIRPRGALEKRFPHEHESGTITASTKEAQGAWPRLLRRHPEARSSFPGATTGESRGREAAHMKTSSKQESQHRLEMASSISEAEFFLSALSICGVFACIETALLVGCVLLLWATRTTVCSMFWIACALVSVLSPCLTIAVVWKLVCKGSTTTRHETTDEKTTTEET